LILSVNAMLREMGREELHEDTISGYIGHGAPQLVRRALGGSASDQECERALQFFCSHYKRAQTGQHLRLSRRGRKRSNTSLLIRWPS